MAQAVSSAGSKGARAGFKPKEFVAESWFAAGWNEFWGSVGTSGYYATAGVVTGETGEMFGDRLLEMNKFETGGDFEGSAGDWYRFARNTAGEMTGLHQIVEGVGGHDIANGQELSGTERVARFSGGVAGVSGTAAGGLSLATKVPGTFPTLSKVGSLQPTAPAFVNRAAAPIVSKVAPVVSKLTPSFIKNGTITAIKNSVISSAAKVVPTAIKAGAQKLGALATFDVGQAVSNVASKYIPQSVKNVASKLSDIGSIDLGKTVQRYLGNEVVPAANGLIHGSGNAPGIIEIGARAKSTAVFRNQLSNERLREFVYLPDEGIFAINKHLDYRNKGSRFPGSDGSPHSTIRSTLPEAKNVVGGNIRYQNGKYVTDELSGHYGRNWTDDIRAKFRQFMNQQGFEVDHNAF